MEVMDILGWNVYIGNQPHEVRLELHKMLLRHKPEVAVLIEAARMKGHLDNLGYEVVQMRSRPLKPGNQPAQGNIAILVRKDIEIVSKRALRMKTFWKGPKHGWPQDPRVYRSVKIKKNNRIWKIAGAHTPFGKKARIESRNRLIKWLKRAIPGRPSVLVLDANMSEATFRDRIAEPVGGVETGGYRIDLIAVKNADLDRVQNLGLHGSDHPAMLYRVVK